MAKKVLVGFALMFFIVSAGAAAYAKPEKGESGRTSRKVVDYDKDGFNTRQDCNDNDPAIYPGAEEICGDGIDQDCNGTDVPCSGGPHAGLVFSGYPQNCLSCHETEANEMYGSTHYQWTGEAPDMVNSPDIPQGKLTNAVNSYCINILGDWPVCGSCHAGRGKRPDDPGAGLENIDCLVCHNEE